MIKNILVGYSGQHGSEVAFRLAAGLAHAAQARLHLAYVEPLAAQTDVALSPEVSADAYPPVLPDTFAAPPDDPSEAPSVFGDLAEQCREERIQCTFDHLHGDAGRRLCDLARRTGLMALGRHEGVPGASAPLLGSVARHVATRMPAPLLLAAREHQDLKRLTLIYEPTSIGGRTLALAGEIAHLQNLGLNVVALGYEHVEPAVAAEEARTALRAYHVEGDVLPVLTSGAEALQTAVLTWNDALLVLAVPPRRWLSRPLDSLRPAFALPNLSVLLVP
jgi:nucleotide-binding universal stress UspA family protein